MLAFDRTRGCKRTLPADSRICFALALLLGIDQGSQFSWGSMTSPTPRSLAAEWTDAATDYSIPLVVDGIDSHLLVFTDDSPAGDRPKEFAEVRRLGGTRCQSTQRLAANGIGGEGVTRREMRRVTPSSSTVTTTSSRDR